MCGLFGTTRPCDEDAVRKMTALIDHRGPDSNDFLRLPLENDRELTLVHTRLAVQDLSPAGHQPMHDRSGRWTVSYNGELYNQRELRASLEVEFRGTSDTETLVEHLEGHGIETTVRRLNGMFAFAAHDRTRSRLYLVRDTFGIKPLYYQLQENGEVTFASEITPLLQFLNSPGRLDPAALETFLTLRYVPSPDTLLTGIRRVPAGHYLEVDLVSRESRLVRYCEPSSDRFVGTLHEATERYQSLLKAAVERQMIADVPVGILLSGGIDSALIAALSREVAPDIQGFTVGFGEDYAECEIAEAADTAAQLQVGHQATLVTPEDLRIAIPQVVRSVEEPLGTTSILPMWHLSRMAREQVTVVLTGQGSDEPWGGYRRYQIELLLARIPFLRSSLFRFPENFVSLIRHEPSRRGLRCLGRRDPGDRFRQAYCLFTAASRKRLTGSAPVANDDRIEGWLAWLQELPLTDAERMMRIDTRMNLSDDLLLYGDKISMAFALEARVPMLDPHLVAFVESLPLTMRSTLRKTKIVHRAMARRYLPRGIVDRPKKNFQVPFGRWSRGIWRDYVQQTLLSSGNKMFDHLDRQEVTRLWTSHLAGRPDQSRQIFSLLMLSIWCNEFL